MDHKRVRAIRDNPPGAEAAIVLFLTDAAEAAPFQSGVMKEPMDSYETASRKTIEELPP
jgi:hypothetical protein